MNAKTNTPGTTTPTKSAPLPSRRQRTEWYPPASQSVNDDTFQNVVVEQDPDGARRFGEGIQDASRRTERAALRSRNEHARGLRYAADKFANAAVGAGDPTATWARGLVQEIREYADLVEGGAPVPDPSNIRPEAPGDGTEADRA